MSEKYAVVVLVPALGKTLEFMVPSVMITSSAKSLIVKIITEQFRQQFENNENLWLIDLESHKRVPLELTFSDAGIRNGSRLMLVNIS